MIINILAGGPTDLLPNLIEYNEEECKWVGVDKGVFTLLSQNIKPAIAFGDFDSVTEEELRIIRHEVEQIQTFVPEKNETDMELALNWATEQDPKIIRIFGATGGRLDHFLANVQLLLRRVLRDYPFPIEIIDKSNILFAVGPGTHHLNKLQEKKYVSFIPITPEVKGLSLTGFKYALKNSHIPIGSTLCISNELINDHGTFSFQKGILMVVRSAD